MTKILTMMLALAVVVPPAALAGDGNNAGAEQYTSGQQGLQLTPDLGTKGNVPSARDTSEE